MADFQYSADLELNTRDFSRNLAEAERALNRFGKEAQTGAVDKGLLELNKRFQAIRGAGDIYTATMRKMGEGSRIAQSQMKLLANQSEKLLRDLNKYGAGTTTTGLKPTQVEKDNSKIIRDMARAMSEFEKRTLAADKAMVRLNADHARAIELNKKFDQKRAFDSYAGNITHARMLENQSKATQQAIRDQDAFVDSLGNARYALYDVSNALGAVSLATLGLSTAATVLSAQYERAFADVERTSGATGQQLSELHDSLIGLTTEMPTSFADITAIATLGGQLGIAAENIDDFTRTVSQFSATTDVTVEAAAEGFGRLAQLTETPQSEMQNLGSAIYEVGINSVATESAILGVAQQIAVSGNLAGFSADQIVALSGALASLGVAPEAARGSIMRIFNEIRTAVDAGGESLELFASTAQMSSEEFANMWRNDPQGAFLALVHGFENAASSGQNLIGIMQEMGVWAVRDQRALQLLADNTEIYEQAIADSTSAYAEGTALGEGYAIVAETVSAKVMTLIQTLKSLVSEGFAPLLGFVSRVLDFLQPLADALVSFAQSPIGGAIISWVGGLTALVGVVALLGAGWARLTGAMIAVLQSMNAAVRVTRDSEGSQRSLNGAIREHIALLIQQKSALAGSVVGNKAANQALAATAAANNVAAVSASRATVAMKGLTAVGRFAGPIAIFTAAVWALGKAFEFVAEATKSSATRADEFFGAGSTGLSQAIKKDTAALAEGAEAYRTYTYRVTDSGERLASTAKVWGGAVRDATSEIPGWQSALEDSAGTQGALEDSTRSTTDAIREQTVAIGDNARQFLAESLVNNEEFQEFFKRSQGLFQELGISIRDVLEEAMSNPGGGAAVFDREITKIEARLAELGADEHDPWTWVGENRAEIESLVATLTQLRDARNQFAAVDFEIGDTLSQMQLMDQVSQALGVDLSATGDEAEEFGAEMASLAEGLFDSVNAVGEFTSAMIGLHESLAENGNDFSSYTESGVANMQALQAAVEAAAAQAGTDVGQFGANLASIFAQMEGAGYTAGSELDFLRQQLINTFNQSYGLDLDISNARGSIHQFIADAIAALQVRANLERSTFLGISGGGGRAGKPERAGRDVLRSSNIPDPVAGIEAQIAELQRLQSQLRAAEKTGKKTGQGIRDAMDQGAGGAKRAGDAAKKATDDAKDAAKELYTLVDYASDLGSIMERALDLRFGNDVARDDTTGILQSMRDAAAETAEKIRNLKQEIRDLRAELGTLAADRKILNFQLGVAIEYGDELRAAEIRAELAENSAEAADKQDELKDTQKDLRKEQDKDTKSLTGNSKSAIDNRKTVLDLVDSYRDQLTTMAANGATQQQLRQRAAELKEEFRRQLTQMGYNRQEVEKYAKAFDDFSTIIREVPRNITITAKASTSPATQALNEWIAKNKNRSITVKTNITTPKVSGTVSGGSWKPSSIGVGTGGIRTGDIRVTRRMSAGSINARADVTSSYIRARNYVVAPYIRATRGLSGPTRARGLSTGGVVEHLASGGVSGAHPGGPRGTDTVPAWLTPGEFVHNRAAVNHYGLPFMNALNSMKIPKYYASGGGVQKVAASGSNGIQLVEILPHQFRELVNATADRVVKLNNATIAQATNKTNARSAQRGSN